MTFEQGEKREYNMADFPKDLEAEVEAKTEPEVGVEAVLEAGVEAGVGPEPEAYSVLVSFVTDNSVSEGAALNFLERVKEKYGFLYEPLYTAGVFDWDAKDPTKRRMARTYAIRGFPTEGEADKFAADLEGKKGINQAYRELPVAIDENDPYLGEGEINDKIDGMMR